jgi:hypothetical protein
MKIIFIGKHDFVFESKKQWKDKPYFDIGHVQYDLVDYYYIHLWRFCWCFYGCPYLTRKENQE